MSKAKDVFDGLEMEGIARILEKQKAIEANSPVQRANEQKSMSSPQPVKLSDYIRRSSQIRDNSRQSAKKGVEGASTTHSPSTWRKINQTKEEIYQDRLIELKEFVKKNINSEQNYSHFEKLLESMERASKQVHAACETQVQAPKPETSTNASSFQCEPAGPVLRPKFEDFNANDEHASPKVTKKKVVQFSNTSPLKLSRFPSYEQKELSVSGVMDKP